MNDKTYGLMNWRDVESIVYADLTNPHEILGLKRVKGGTLIQVYRPEAEGVKVIFDEGNLEYELQKEDESGFFALFVRKKLSGLYKILTQYKKDDDIVEKMEYDSYQFAPVFPEKNLVRFSTGIEYDIADYMGAHIETVNGIKGTRFAVWAPEALRVSVVGDFNSWDGRLHIMTKHEEFGVFEIFIPEIVGEGDIYKYEIRKKGGDVYLKSDPYGFSFQEGTETATVVTAIDGYKWSDGKWFTARKKTVKENGPLLIGELQLDKLLFDMEGNKKTLAQVTGKVLELCKEANYTHIELMPVMEHYDEDNKYFTTGYYALDSDYGTPYEFMDFVNTMHNNNIGVILDWVPAYFPKYDFGLGRFDGSALYEHLDSRKGEHKGWNAYSFNYGRPQVSNYLIGSGLFWCERYHADGIRINGLPAMLYLDYDREDGQWIPNIYGGKENLEAVELLKHFNSIVKKRNKDVLVIGQDASGWPMLTAELETGEGLGFDYKWNDGWNNDTKDYFRTSPEYRKDRYEQLNLSQIYAYAERYILTLNHDDMTQSLVDSLPGTDIEKVSNLKAMYGFMMTHPGKKLVYPQLNLKDGETMQDIVEFINDINKIYIEENALYYKDNDPDGFEWINCIAAEKNTLSFVRKGQKSEDLLLVVCNLGPAALKSFQVGVPKAGKYKELINSDGQQYGGSGITNPRVKTSSKKKCDGLENSITVNMAPYSISLLKYRKGEK